VNLLRCLVDHLDLPLNSFVLDGFDTDEEALVLVHGELSSVSRDRVQDVHFAGVVGVEVEGVREGLDLSFNGIEYGCVIN
jgi:hypothetical protein